MTWQVLASDVVSGAGAKQVGRRLWLRDQLVYEYGFTWNFIEQSTIASGSWTTIVSMSLEFPAYFVSGDDLNVSCWAKGGGGGGTHQLRLNIGATNGTAVNVTNGSSYAREDMAITAASTPSGVTTVNIQGNDDAADSVRLQIKGVNLLWNCWFTAG